ncbi:hypothetical protein JW835_01250 [bacterium]|nr:hypothetical protein [bacterium]
MISFEVIKQAKAFLCWDCYKDLSIQLIPIRESLAYYYPPAQMGSIVLFYNPDAEDFTTLLYLLFHEAGHHSQQKSWLKNNKSEAYWKTIQTPTGSDKMEFEKESWDRGRNLFQKFLQKENINIELLDNFDSFSIQQIKTYDTK